MDIIVRAIRQFDVVAIQEVRAQQQDVVPRLVELLNVGGRRYSYVLGPRQGRTESKEQYAFLFDEATLEVDRTKGYTIKDPDDVLHRPPLVACFRSRGPPPDQAFTFTLVNVHTDPDEVSDEMNRMDDVLYSVRADGRGEDDVILLGDFNTDDHHLGELGRVAGLTAALSGQNTNTRQTSQLDNLFFELPATSEYTGRSGVFDFLRHDNLTLEQCSRSPITCPFGLNSAVLKVVAPLRWLRHRRLARLGEQCLDRISPVARECMQGDHSCVCRVFTAVVHFPSRPSSLEDAAVVRTAMVRFVCLMPRIKRTKKSLQCILRIGCRTRCPGCCR